jgi:hypothetical protein
MFTDLYESSKFFSLNFPEAELQTVFLGALVRDLVGQSTKEQSNSKWCIMCQQTS